jgi:hypothetical protein
VLGVTLSTWADERRTFVDSSIVSALIGGGCALIGVIIGSLFTYRLTVRTFTEQRAYAEALRKSELAREEHREFHPVRAEEKPVISSYLDKGGATVLPVH